LVTAALLVAGGLIWAAPSSFAVHDNGTFELDGNIVDNSGPGQPWDWGSLFDASGNRLVTPDPDNGPLLASTWQNDTAEPDSSYFASSNKDIDPVSTWQCGVQNNAQAKDNLLHAYAALVQVPNNAPDNAGHTVLYLGSERESNNGNSFAGFWLMKNSNTGCTNGNFTGGHTDGDILVLSNYTNGGGTQNVTVYRWSGNDATGSAVHVASFDGATCGGAANDNACAIANSGTITSPWSPTSHPSNTFVEAGIDMTALLGQAGGCFTTFLAETRTSQQITATLKDFTRGQFNTCATPPIATTATPGGDLVPLGATNQHDVATISAVGNRPDPTGTIDFFLCNPSEVTAGGCESGGTQVGGDVPIANKTATSINAPGSLITTTGVYCWRAVYAPDQASSAFYLGGSETNHGSECFTVVHGAPTIATQIQVTGAHPPGLGLTTLGDTATLSGFAGSVAGELITFNLYDTTATPGCAGVPVFTTTGTLDAQGNATTAATYDPTLAHTYVWIASYAGDPLNDGVTGKCADANESVTIVGAQIDVSKSANPPGPVNAGENIGFDLTVTNSGAIPALGVHVHDVLPAGADGVPGGDLNWALDPSYAGCAISGAPGSQVLDCNFTEVDGPGSLPVIHISSPTSQADCGVVKNKATISTTNGTGTDSDIATVTVLCPHLTISKSADAASVSVGSPIGFTVTVTNDGQGSASNVDMEDPLPTGPHINWTIDGAGTSGPLSCSIVAGPTLKCTGTLGSGASEVVHITSPTAWNVDGNSCGTYDNTASVTAANFTGNPSASASEDVLCPDLSIAKSADAAAVNAGTQIGFTVTVHNSDAAGTGSASGVTINDPLPTGSGINWQIESQTSNACAINVISGVQTLQCTIGVMTPGSTYTVHIVSDTSFASCGDYKNVATVNASNEPAKESLEVTTSVLCADLVIQKTADADQVSVGQDIGFSVTISNVGSGAALGVDEEDPLPAGPANSGVSWSIQSASGPLTCVIDGSAPNQTLKCTGTLAASGSADATETVHITSHTVWNSDLKSCGVYDNTATVTWGNGPDTPISSNLASETVLCPSLGIIKDADAESVSAGDQIGFSIEVTNGGPGVAFGVTLNDPLPSGGDVNWSIESVTGTDPGNCSITGAVGAQVLVCSLGDVPPSADIKVHIVSGTTGASCSTYDNTATLQATNEPGLQGSASTAVLCPSPAVAKTADADLVNAGEQIGFTITASNGDAPGTGTAKGVAINDPLPGGPGIDWSIAPGGPSNCSITGAVPNQTLVCTGVDLAPGESYSVHVVSGTQFDSCATYDNTATLTLTNGAPALLTAVELAADDSPLEASASTSVQCPALTLTKTADAPSVKSGAQIGFTITFANAGPGVASGVTLNDPLPSGGGVSWSIDTAGTTATGCAVNNVLDKQVLNCTIGALDAGVSMVVHLVSGTTLDSCTTYHNVATLNATNSPSLTAGADTQVTHCLQISPTPSTVPPAITGAGPVQSELGAVVLLLGVGGVLLLAGRRPRRRGQHVD
jgi:uncharacterized repeat protein (TIGR01451 family)